MRENRAWSKGVWKLVAILALSAALIQAAVGIYVVLAFKSNMDVLTAGAPICLADMENFDSIAAAQAIGRLDLVSFLLTTGGILLGVFSLIGFWTIRREAMEEARDAALEEVKRVLPLLGLDENGKGTHISGGTRASRRATRKSRGTKPSVATQDPSGVSTAGAVREKSGESDVDPQGGA